MNWPNINIGPAKNVISGYSVTSYGKTQTSLFANPIYTYTHT